MLAVLVLALAAKVGVEAGQILAVEQGLEALVGGRPGGQQGGGAEEEPQQQAKSESGAHGAGPSIWGE